VGIFLKPMLHAKVEIEVKFINLYVILLLRNSGKSLQHGKNVGTERSPTFRVLSLSNDQKN
jgi:hypothetical protein